MEVRNEDLATRRGSKSPKGRKRKALMAPIKKIGAMVGQGYIQYKSKQLEMGPFQQKVALEIDSSRYLVRTVSRIEELRKTLRLRYKVFFLEGMKKRKSIGMDLEPFDFVADHLIVIDKASREIVGTYRLISSLFSSSFYSQAEFVLDEFLKEPGTKLELGRACIHPEHRNGAVIALLWKGLHEYMTLTESRFLFGCASIKTVNLNEIAAVYHYLIENQLVSDKYHIRPTPAYRVEGLDSGLQHGWQMSADPKDLEARNLVPSLLRSYFKAGAKVMGEPALDRDFECIDFLTILEKDLLDSGYSKKFGSK